MKKKVLIITYYWPPSGGAGVQRWLKFVKYFREFGWEPIIYAPENAEYPSEDYSIEKDIPEGVLVIKTPIWEPYNVYRNLFGKKGEKINAGFISEKKKSGWKDKLSIWIRGNFLIPDPRRFWIKPSVKFLTEYLKENPADAIVTTGPPHSMHMIGFRLKKILPNVKWVADFRDPWTNIDFYRELNLTFLADRIHHKLERKVVQSADCVVVVSNDMVDEFSILPHKKIELITNGYDSEDVSGIDVKTDNMFSLSHIGTLNAARNPITLWKVLGEICQKDENFRSDLKIKLIGKTDFSVLQEIDKNGLTGSLEKTEYLSHSGAIEKQQQSQLLLLLINHSTNAKGILTGKFFEYLASKRPILAVGPSDGEVARVLQETNAGKIVDFDDKTATKNTILTYYELYKTGSLTVKSHSVERFSRKSLTGEMANLLNTL